jgi:hypothetical protein
MGRSWTSSVCLTLLACTLAPACDSNRSLRATLAQLAPAPAEAASAEAASTDLIEVAPVRAPAIQALPPPTAVPPTAQPAMELPAMELPPTRQWFERVLAKPASSPPPDPVRRARLLLRANAEPVLFVRAPQPEPTDSAVVLAERVRITRGRRPAEAVSRLLRRFAGSPRVVGAVLLAEGYLYADEPELAAVLSDIVEPQHVTDSARIWLQRGGHTLFARRERGAYYYVDGPLANEPVRLRLFDRLGVGVPPPPLHRDLRSLSDRLGFDELRVRHLTENEIVMDLRYGEHWVPTGLVSQGSRLEPVVELIGSNEAAAVQARREENRQWAAALQVLRRAMLEQINEQLPFDEPLTEEGQQDGRLRYEWMRAYDRGRLRYTFNSDFYDVFGPNGVPLVPQVCSDFVLDTFERASGTWWTPEDQPRRRVLGQWDWSPYDRIALRNTGQFVEFARQHPELFYVLDVPKSERVMLGDSPGLSAYLLANADEYQPGDIVVIRGETPWDQDEPHTHVFLIYESDPLTRVPIVLASNPGPATLASWENESRRTPLRALFQRVRPRQDWIRSIVSPPALPPAEEEGGSVLPAGDGALRAADGEQAPSAPAPSRT